MHAFPCCHLSILLNACIYHSVCFNHIIVHCWLLEAKLSHPLAYISPWSLSSNMSILGFLLIVNPKSGWLTPLAAFSMKWNKLQVQQQKETLLPLPTQLWHPCNWTFLPRGMVISAQLNDHCDWLSQRIYDLDLVCHFWRQEDIFDSLVIVLEACSEHILNT